VDIVKEICVGGDDEARQERYPFVGSSMGQAGL